MVLNIYRHKVISNDELNDLQRAVILPSLKPIIRRFFSFAPRNFIAYLPMRDSLGDEKALFGFKVIRVNFDWSDIIFYSRYKQQQINFCGYNREEIVQELESTMFRYPDPPFNPWAD